MERGRNARDAVRSERARTSLWRLIHTSLLALLSVQRRRLGWVDDEELRDIAAEKAAELLLQFDRGRWELAEASAWQCRGFMATVARNGLVDALRRRRSQEIGGDDAEAVLSQHADTGAPAQASLGSEQHSFVRALIQCLHTLKERDRTVWMLRVVHDLPTRRIAQHPEVRLRRGHVDVILHRCRESIRGCMQGRGYEAQDLPPGVFTELWTQLHAGRGDES